MQIYRTIFTAFSNNDLVLSDDPTVNSLVCSFGLTFLDCRCNYDLGHFLFDTGIKRLWLFYRQGVNVLLYYEEAWTSLTFPCFVKG